MRETKLNNKDIETPRASLYYQELIDEHEEFKSLNVNLIKNKVRKLREQRLKNAGMGLITDHQGYNVEGKQSPFIV